MDTRGKSRILIVHPDEPERRRLQEIATAKGARGWMTHEAGSADEALAMYHAFAPDCVVIEHAPPELDALGFINRLKRQSSEPNPPVVVLAEPASASSAIRALQMGAQDCLVKSRIHEDLGYAIEAVVEKGKLFRQIKEHRRDLELGAKALQESEERHRVLVEGVTDYAIVMLDPQGRIISWNVGAENLFRDRAEDVAGEPYARYFTREDRDRGDPERLLGLASETGRAVEERWMIRKNGELFPANIAVSPLRDHDGILRGFATVARDVTERMRNQGEIMELNAHLERRLRRINALRRIDLAITSGRELGAILRVVVEQARGELGVEAALILIVDPMDGTLAHAAGVGLPEGFTPALENGSAGLARRVAQSGCALHVLDLARVLTPDPRLPRLLEHGFRSYHAVPLVVAERVLGVMECFCRDDSAPDPEWLDFLRILARQASIAIEHVELFAGLRDSNAQLGLAYDATIEGLSRAMDLRDHETEGHSRRVTELTVALGRKMGLSERELVQVRRGALLHDIGKLGVPDQILLKPAALTDDEWVVMKRHPAHAVEILNPIDFLRPALDIPRCHHERFDGQGYPAGLAGDAIPLAARMFAVVDVWDALSNDRPYRKAWPKERVVEHLKTLAGNHLDPQVVDEFLNLMTVAPCADAPSSAETTARGTAPGDFRREFTTAAAPRVLCVLGEGDRALEFVQSLGELGVEPALSSNPEDAWRRIEEQPFEILFIDAPGSHLWSRELITRLRGMSGRPHTHVIAVQDVEPEGDAPSSPSSLVDDVLFRPATRGEIGFRIELARRSLELRRELLTRSVDADRLQDQLRRRDQRLADLAAKDPLTGLANRRLFLETLDSYLAMSSRRGEPISIMILDLDYFRAFNDDLGHAVGDEALRTVAAVLRGAVRRNDLASRHGGDEFVVLMTPCDQETARVVADRIRASLAQENRFPRPIAASLGLATCSAAPWDGAELLTMADHALAIAKRRGRDRAVHHADLTRPKPLALVQAGAIGA